MYFLNTPHQLPLSIFNWINKLQKINNKKLIWPNGLVVTFPMPPTPTSEILHRILEKKTKHVKNLHCNTGVPQGSILGPL